MAVYGIMNEPELTNHRVRALNIFSGPTINMYFFFLHVFFYLTGVVMLKDSISVMIVTMLLFSYIFC